MRDLTGRVAVCAMLLFIIVERDAVAADQSSPGPGNPAAIALSAKSPLVRSAKEFLLHEVALIGNPTLREATRDAIANDATCIRHRAGLDAEKKAALLDRLKAEGLVAAEDEERIPGGLLAGIFPPLKDEGSDCPHLAQTYDSSPGSVFGGHHSYPGGLPVHVAVNLTSSLALADTYRRVYGHSNAAGQAEIVAAGMATPAQSDIAIDQDIIIAAPLWHDWAKTMVFQWTAEGGEFAELNFGGAGKTDKFGTPGDSRTGGHHIIGIAETMKRGLPKEFVVAQASAHSAPTGGNEYLVVNWLRAAAILAQIDPVASGYLTKDELGRFRLPVVRSLASVNLQGALPNEPNLLVEYVLHNLSDADYTFSGPAVAEAQILLRVLAERFGYDMNDTAAFNLRFRNPVLSHMGAERLQILYAGSGIDAVAAELGKLKKAGVI
jgi:hypothetical protein